MSLWPVKDKAKEQMQKKTCKEIKKMVDNCRDVNISV